jgi:lecithin-cholesterol acyltransferase
MLFLLSVALKPVIFVPGTMATLLKGTTTRKDFWYCPKVKDDIIYFNKEYIVPPLYNCMFTALHLEYDEANNYYKNVEGVEMGSFDWGGFTPFEFVDIIPNHPTYTVFGECFNYLKLYGYEEKVNYFGAAFDWRFGTIVKQAYWDNLTALVEQASQLNGHSPCALVGHSLGGFMVQLFLTRYTTAEWRKTYIDCAVLFAPSFGGSGLAFKSLVTGQLPILAEIMSSHLAATVRSMGCLHAQLPNHFAHGDKIISYDKNGNGLKASDFQDLLENEGYVEKDIFSISRNVPAEDIEQPDVPVAILYNTAIETVIGYNIQTGKDVVGRGDLVITAEGPEYVCRKWSNDKAKFVCHDFNESDAAYNHLGLIMLEQTVSKAMQYIFDDSWKN